MHQRLFVPPAPEAVLGHAPQHFSLGLIVTAQHGAFFGRHDVAVEQEVVFPFQGEQFGFFPGFAVVQLHHAEYAVHVQLEERKSLAALVASAEPVFPSFHLVSVYGFDTDKHFPAVLCHDKSHGFLYGDVEAVAELHPVDVEGVGFDGFPVLHEVEFAAVQVDVAFHVFPAAEHHGHGRVAEGGVFVRDGGALVDGSLLGVERKGEKQCCGQCKDKCFHEVCAKVYVICRAECRKWFLFVCKYTFFLQLQEVSVCFPAGICVFLSFEKSVDE